MLAFGLASIVITLGSVCVHSLSMRETANAVHVPEKRGSCWLLLTLFAELQHKQGVESTVNFSGSITTVRAVLAIAVVVGSLGVGAALLMVADPVVRRNYYILIPTLLLAGSLVVVVSTVIFVLRMK